MSDSLDRLLDRIAQARRRFTAELAAARRPPVRAEDRQALDHAPGAQVFDPITGQHGEVIGGSVENIVSPSAKR